MEQAFGKGGGNVLGRSFKVEVEALAWWREGQCLGRRRLHLPSARESAGQ